MFAFCLFVCLWLHCALVWLFLVFAFVPGFSDFLSCLGHGSNFDVFRLVSSEYLEHKLLVPHNRFSSGSRAKSTGMVIHTEIICLPRTSANLLTKSTTRQPRVITTTRNSSHVVEHEATKSRTRQPTVVTIPPSSHAVQHDATTVIHTTPTQNAQSEKWKKVDRFKVALPFRFIHPFFFPSTD